MIFRVYSAGGGEGKPGDRGNECFKQCATYYASSANISQLRLVSERSVGAIRGAD